ncbi:MAG TPA: electron transfer flavoprotein subunit alpha/FixB family protein, partial [Caballeronia sp.]|nr:electron transfer flavoprotein subunit alpha/FixB family protein [Caballeronia sp.]
DLPNPETLAALLQRITSDYSMIAASHRTAGRAALPRAAALSGNAFLADITRVVSAQRFVRGLYAGSVVATIESTSTTLFATIRTSSFAPACSTGGTASIVALDPIAPFTATVLIDQQGAALDALDLSSARIVVAGGRGLASKENMDTLGALARNMGAALGASRAAVDAGYAPNAAQVGQTGKTVAPDIYLAFGISGAIQHLAGMKDSQVIVAVNKDPDAPIFSVADYGIVGDLFDVMGELDAHARATGNAS